MDGVAETERERQVCLERVLSLIKYSQIHFPSFKLACFVWYPIFSYSKAT